MANLRQRWKRTPVAIRKPFIAIIGSTVIATGLMLLVLPGPGWAAIFLGFAILATEFAFAEKVRDWTVKELKTIGHATSVAFKRKKDKIKHKLK